MAMYPWKFIGPIPVWKFGPPPVVNWNEKKQKERALTLGERACLGLTPSLACPSPFAHKALGSARIRTREDFVSLGTGYWRWVLVHLLAQVLLTTLAPLWLGPAGSTACDRQGLYFALPGGNCALRSFSVGCACNVSFEASKRRILYQAGEVVPVVGVS